MIELYESVLAIEARLLETAGNSTACWTDP
jgi:hypothetical protein